MAYECSREIRKKVSEAALYEQLAEECVELAHAALKLARIKRGENPTPVSVEEAMSAVLEEYTDLRLVAYVLEMLWDVEAFEQKLLRWCKRLVEVNGDAADCMMPFPMVIAGAELTDAELIEKIRKAPIVLKPNVDAVPVVRCRDCKWWEKGQTTDGVKGFCPISGCCEGPDFYCADGERREENTK